MDYETLMIAVSTITEALNAQTVAIKELGESNAQLATAVKELLHEYRGALRGGAHRG